jgi:hypothetical protein
MRTRTATAVAAGALLAMVLGGVVRTASAGPSTSTSTTEMTVVIGLGGGALTELDFDHDGLTMGDRVVFRGPLYDESMAHKVGQAKGECVVQSNKITQTSGMWRCSYIVELEGGDVIIEGLDPRGDGSSKFAIVGGTETYSSATGDADLVDGGGVTTMHLHIEI